MRLKEPIPLRKCKHCRRFKNGYCSLEDLAPCSFKRTQEAQNERDKNILLVAVVVVSGLLFLIMWLLAGRPKIEPTPDPITPRSVTSLLREYHRNELSEFDKLTLAIALTESHFDPQAVGANNDFGCLQITPVYVAEVNRVAGTHYAHEDAFDIHKSVEMFSLIQDYHNPERDIEKAIRLHNKSAAYRTKVLENLETIRRYEALREELTK